MCTIFTVCNKLDINKSVNHKETHWLQNEKTLFDVSGNIRFHMYILTTVEALALSR